MVGNQYTNHFPGSFVLGRKDALWALLSSQVMPQLSLAFSSAVCDLHQIRQHGSEYDFIAKTYILPRDRKPIALQTRSDEG